MEKGFEALIIDEEFKNLIRPLRREEYQQLEINLSVDGCREPIITWNRIIIDGHNRYEICNRRHIPYAVEEMPFASREDAAAFGRAVSRAVMERYPQMELYQKITAYDETRTPGENLTRH